jgi:hypothetical protein
LTITETGTQAREAVALALEAAARLVREHPDLPLAPAWALNPLEVTIAAASDEARIAEIGRIAGILRDAGYETADPGRAPGTRRVYGVSARIGAGLAYRAVTIISPFGTVPAEAVTGAAA